MYYYKTNGGIIAVANPIDGEEITAEEFAALKASIKIPVWTDAMQAQYERTRPFTAEEVNRMVIAQQINTLAVDDNTALRMVEFYPEWAENTAYTKENEKPVGYKVQRGGKLWKLKQEHTSIPTWEPENAASLWEVINETHSGTEDDPIPYDGNMALEQGKHYMQNYVIYLCTRDTVNPVYNPLAELVGLYVEAV